MLNTFYKYYQTDKKVEDLNLTDRNQTYQVGRFINQGAHAQYSTNLGNKGRSTIAFTERQHEQAYT